MPDARTAAKTRWQFHSDLHRAVHPAELEAALRESLRAAESGERCDCGEPIWALGSAIVGRGCFTCITGEGSPSDDYEITRIR